MKSESSVSQMSEGTNQRSPERELAYFICLANETCDEAMEELEAPLDFLAAIDLLYMDFFKQAGPVGSPTASILLLNAHSSLRGGIRMALSGQLLPVFMTLRGAIESALYAYAIVVNPVLQAIWLNRHANEESRQACRRAFSAAKMFRLLEQRLDRKEFAVNLSHAYESTIDFGAHPNSLSLLRSIRIEDIDGGMQAMDFTYIHGSGSFEVRQSLVACAEIGLAVFFVALMCFENHPRITNLNERALALNQRVSSFIQELGLASKGGAPTPSSANTAYRRSPKKKSHRYHR